MPNPSRTSRMISRSLRMQCSVFRIGKSKYMLGASIRLLSFGLVLLGCQTGRAGTAGGLSGRIVDLEDRPLPGVAIRASDLERKNTLRAVSDSSGSYSFAILPPGSYQLLYELVGFGSREAMVQILGGERRFLDVALAVRQPSEDLLLCICDPVLDGGSGRASVPRLTEQRIHVVDPMGHPVPGATVSVRGLTLTTDDDGTVCFWRADGENLGFRVLAFPFRSLAGETCCFGADARIALRVDFHVAS